MRYWYVLVGAFLLSSCSQNAQSLPSTNALGIQNVRPNASGPVINKISRVKAKQYQKIVISGSGFGTMQPYNGDSAYLQILDQTGGWSAGLLNGSQDDFVNLDVTNWTNKKITITGFTGDYGQSYWYLSKGDAMEINVWNAQTGAGPGSITTTVK
jgi:hypothetical protein